MKKILTIIIIGILSIILITSIIFLNFNGNKLITAQDGYLLAIDFMDNQFETYYLEHVQNNMDGYYKEGRSSSWTFLFIVVDNNETYVYKRVNIYSNGTKTLWNTAGTTSSLDKVIQNWTIDSVEAYKIAVSDPAINSFINSPGCSFFGSYMIRSNGTVQWSFSWNNAGILDNPKWAEIDINATTGEVLYVEVDD